MSDEELFAEAKAILARNDHGTWTQPAVDMYANQWLWDSCFVAIGLSHYKPQRAIRELRSLFAGQWQNGMVPHQIFHGEHSYRNGARVWRSEVSPLSPPTVATSGITQPPLLAEAVWQIGQQLGDAARTRLYKEFYPKLLAYHLWLYTERNPHKEGLVILLHPWETGMDDTPPWIEELRYHNTPLWISLVDKLQLDKLIDIIRQDAQLGGVHERISTLDALRLYDIVRRLRRKKYVTNQVLRRSIFSIEDLFFNSILIRNNQILADIAKHLRQRLPTQLRVQFAKAPIALDGLWSEQGKQYYSRNFITEEPLASPTLGTLMPLYSRSISKERAAKLVRLLTNKKEYWLPYPVPSVPKTSKYFGEHHYWSGPTWLNTNWLIADGLRFYGFDQEADEIVSKSLELVRLSGFREYFSPIDGHGAGATEFSWTAAVVIDFMARHKTAKK
ncbi:MAG TPA: trehalase family glycosidase [Candidatus Saccharimonadales bacterium]|nr:trehalase family glycosidase [Candidatus Saccharimonadales bacterium]